MPQKERYSTKQKEIIGICLKQFIDNGLCNTSARDLAAALHMQTSGLYYYFKSKEDIVIACAEEAAIYLEDILMEPVLNCLQDTGGFVNIMTIGMINAVPVMKFFAQVCTTNEYRDKMQPVLERMKARHQEYAEKVAAMLHCEAEEVAPYLYACVAIVANYMMFGEELYFTQPFQLIEEAIHSLQKR